MLSPLPPLQGSWDIRAVAEWELEAVLEATPLFGILLLLSTLRSGMARRVGSSSPDVGPATD